MSLSFHLCKAPSTLEGEKLSLVGLDIYFIDIMPAKIAKTLKILYLSNNYISNLENIEQFEQLTIGSLTNNFIRYLDYLQPLSRLQYLQKLSLTGNLVTKMPYYKEHVLILCPNLLSLDGIKITQIDRSRAKVVFFKAKAFYDQLRLNELRNSALVHISKLLACHLELHAEVFGKFSHIGRCGQSGLRYAEVGAGRILQQALRGGVYRWLQLMASIHFNHLVQDNLYKLLVRQYKKQPNDGEDNNTLWSSLVAEYLKEQQEYFLDLVVYCDSLSRNINEIKSRHGNKEDSGIQQSFNESLDNEVLMDGMGQLQFLSMASNHNNSNNDNTHFVNNPTNQSQESCGVGGSRKTLPIKYKDPSNLENKVILRSNKLPVNNIQNKENTVNQQHRIDNNTGIIHQSISDVFNETYENRLNNASHNEEVHQKYAELLHHLDRPISTKIGASTMARKDLSTLLPPQQFEPENRFELLQVQVDQSPDYILSDFELDQQHNNIDVFEAADEQDKLSFPINIDELLNRSLTSNNSDEDDLSSLLESIEQIISEWTSIGETIQKYIETNHLKDIIVRYSTNDQQQFVRVSNDPSLTTMSALKTHIQSLSNRFILSQRDEFAFYEFHKHFKSIINSFEKQVLSITNDAVKIIKQKNHEITECKQDIKYTAVWLEINHEIVAKIETIKNNLVVISQQQSNQIINIDSIHSKLKDQTLIRENLESSLNEVTIELENNSTISSLNKHKRIQDNNLCSSKILLSIKRKIFRLFRQCIKHQLKAKSFHKRIVSRNRTFLLRFIFNRWICYLQIYKIGSKLLHIYQLRLKRKFISLWNHTYLCNYRVVSAAQKLISDLKMKRALYKLNNKTKIKLKAKNMLIRNSLYVAIYSSIRIFRAWKSLIHHSNSDYQSKVAYLNLCKVRKNWVVWKHKSDTLRTKELNIYNIILQRNSVLIGKKYFLNWIALYQFKIFLYDYRCKKHFFLIFKQRLLIRSKYYKNQENLRLKTINRNVKQNTLRCSFMKWRNKILHGRNISNCANQVYLYNRKRIVYKAIEAWKIVSNNFNKLSRKYLATSFYLNITSLQKHFNSWKYVMKNKVDVQVPNNFKAISINIKENHKSDKSINRIKSSMTTLDFSLLYLDDSDLDDDDNNDNCYMNKIENKHISNEESVFVIKSYYLLIKRYLYRWFYRHLKIKILIEKQHIVERKVLQTLQGRYFSKIFEVWISNMSLKQTKYIQSIQLHPCSENQEEYLSARLRILSADSTIYTKKRIDIEQTVDNLTLTLAKAQQDVLCNSIILEDISASIDILNAEHGHLLNRINENTSYIIQFQTIKESMTNNNKIKCSLPSFSLSLDNKQTPSNSSSIDLLSDEKLLLMRDVESLYKTAVSAQEVMIKKKLILVDETNDKYSEIVIKTEEFNYLELQVNELKLQRKELEKSLDVCNVALEKAFAQILIKSHTHEKLLNELFKEENILRRQLEDLCIEEKRITSILEAIQAITVPSTNKKKILNESSVLADKEIASFEHYMKLAHTSFNIHSSNNNKQQSQHSSHHRSCAVVSNDKTAASLGVIDNISSSHDNKEVVDDQNHYPPSATTQQDINFIGKQIDELSFRIKQRFTILS